MSNERTCIEKKVSWYIVSGFDIRLEQSENDSHARKKLVQAFKVADYICCDGTRGDSIKNWMSDARVEPAPTEQNNMFIIYTLTTILLIFSETGALAI